jgi:two-component system, OmpR family, sensor histidine kinase BaeS
MRLRLVHTLLLFLLAAALVAVAAMATVTTWNLQSGFADYLEARDVERLDEFAALAAELAEKAGGIAALRERSPRMRELLDEFAKRQGIMKRPPPPPPPEAGRHAEREALVRERPPPPGGPEGFGPRVTVVNLDGTAIFDRPMQVNTVRFVDRPIRVRGEVVALARLRASARVSDAIEARFLRSQYLGIAAVSSLLVMLALAGAWWGARRWVRPLQAVQSATARIAKGEFGVRVEIAGGEAKRGDEIADLVRDVNQMAEGLQRMEHARRRWLADISHELRTPLTGLRGDIEALVDGVRPLTPAAIVSLREVALQLSTLVNDLHLLAMSDLKALPCRFTEFDAVAFMRQLVRRFEGRAKATGLSLSLKLDGLDRLSVCWDHARIDQLLSNLFQNSLRYTDTPGQIVLTLKAAGTQVVINVDDSSPTVPSEDLPRLFEPLYRAEAARRRHHGGSGLGLAICDAIVRSHGGRIQANLSELGGLQVRIDLPVSAGSPSSGSKQS